MFGLSDDVRALVAERDKQLAAAREITHRARSEKRDLTDEELAICEQHVAKAEKLRVEILDAIKAEGIVATFTFKDGWKPVVTEATGRGTTYESLFGPPAGSDGFSSLGEFLKVVHSGLYHPGLRAPSATMVGGEGASGGFLVPETFAAAMLNKAIENTVLLRRADIRPMTTPVLKVAGFDDSSHASHLFGGLIGYWIPEEGAITPSEPTVRRIELKARKLACLVKASNELVADSPDFERLLGNAIIDGLSWYADAACIMGTGAGQPLGILNDPALIVVPKETSPAQGAGTIVYENLAKMLARLHPACFTNAIWIANPTVLPELLRLQVRVQNAAKTDFVGGSAAPAFSQNGNQYALFGRQIIFTEKLPALGTRGDIILCDPTQYVVGLRKEISVEKSIHPHFSTDVSTYRGILRLDGQGKWASPLTPKNGDTLSWVVTLESRN